MRAWWRPSAGTALFASASLLAALLVANAMVLEDMRIPSSYATSVERGENGTVVMTRLLGVDPGSVVRIQVPPSASGFALYVTEGGGGDALREGREPEGVLLRLDPAPAGRTVDLVRPPSGGPGATRLGWHPDFDQDLVGPLREQARTAVDVVWVDRDPAPPCGHDARQCERSYDEVARQLTQTHGQPRVVLLDATAVRLQPAFYALQALAALGVLAGAVALPAGALRQRRSRGSAAEGGAAPPAPRADSAEGLLDLVTRAEGYLATLRNVLASAGVLLAFLGLMGSLALEEIAFFIDHLKPSPFWHGAIVGGLLAAYVAVVAGWLAALAAAQRELSRFRRRLARAPPLEP